MWFRMLAPTRSVCGTWTPCGHVVTRSVCNSSVDNQIGQRTRSLDGLGRAVFLPRTRIHCSNAAPGIDPLEPMGKRAKVFRCRSGVQTLRNRDLVAARREPADNCYTDSSLAA